MNPRLLRSAMHITGLAVAIALWFLLPFSPLVNGSVAAILLLADTVVAQMLFNRRASPAEKIADLRERVDNPPL